MINEINIFSDFDLRFDFDPRFKYSLKKEGGDNDV